METPAPQHLKFAVLAADTAVFTLRDGQLLVRLITVKRPPHFPNNPGLPGGLIDPQETADDASVRHVERKAGISQAKIYVEQLATFSKVDRDPRGRVVAVAYIGLVPWEKLSEKEREDSEETYWAPITKAKHLAYDHDEVLKTALARLTSRARYTTVIQKIMAKEFTLTELEQAYESVVGKNLDKRNFRKKILKLGILKELPHKREGGPFRPAQLYTFATQKVDEIEVL
jgi:8-oxo-dGTP diphosphatase